MLEVFLSGVVWSSVKIKAASQLISTIVFQCILLLATTVPSALRDPVLCPVPHHCSPLCHICDGSPVPLPSPVTHPFCTGASIYVLPGCSVLGPNQAVLKNLLLYPIKLKNNIIPHGYFRVSVLPWQVNSFYESPATIYFISVKPEATEMAGTCFKCQPH